MPDLFTITVRSRNLRPFPAGGRLWGPKDTVATVPAVTMLDLWACRASLVVAWPVGWIAPDGSEPGRPEPTPPTVDATVAPPIADADVITVDMRLPFDAPPDEDNSETPVVDALPAQVVTESGTFEPTGAPSLPPVTTSAYTTKNATLHATLSGHLVDVLDKLGAKALPSPEERELGPGLLLERFIDSLAAERAVDLRMSKVQRALVRAASAQPLGGIFAKSEELFHFGAAGLKFRQPNIISLRCGIRAGKTLIASLAVLWTALTCSTRRPITAEELEVGVLPGADGMRPIMQPGERVRVLFVTPEVNQSKQAFGYVLNAVRLSPRLRRFIVHGSTTRKLILRRPHDGVEVLFEMVAASAQGNNVRSGWLAGAVFDEGAFFGDDEAVVNLKDNLGAASTRLLPGAQVWLPSSPWADAGHYHEEHTKAFGNPGNTLAFHSSSMAMNPMLNTPEKRAEIDARRVEDALLAAREYDAIPLSALSNLFFTPTVLKLCVNLERTEESGLLTLPPVRGTPHYAGTDLGFRKNSSTLAIARNIDRLVSGKSTSISQLAYYEERIPPQGHPLVPGEVIKGFGNACQEYRCSSMRGDNSDTPTAREHLATLPGAPVEYDEYIPTQERNADLFDRVRQRMSEGCVELPNDARLLGQLKRVTARPTEKGKTQISLPKQGRAHGDIVAALMLALDQAISGAKPAAPYDATYDRVLSARDTRGYGSARGAASAWSAD